MLSVGVSRAAPSRLIAGVAGRRGLTARFGAAFGAAGSRPTPRLGAALGFALAFARALGGGSSTGRDVVEDERVEVEDELLEDESPEDDDELESVLASRRRFGMGANFTESPSRAFSLPI